MKEGYHSFSVGEQQGGRFVLYRYRMIKCGRKNCRKCPHGPYLYCRAFESVGSGWKEVERYVGKVGSEKEQEVMYRLLARCAELEGGPRNAGKN